MAILASFRRRRAVGRSAFLASAIITLAVGPAFAQKPALNLLREQPADPATEAYRKQIEQEYNSAIRKIPEPKKKSSDPWGSVRSVEPTKK